MCAELCIIPTFNRYETGNMISPSLLDLQYKHIDSNTNSNCTVTR